MLEASTRKLLKLFLEVEFCITSRDQAFAETVILSLTSGDALLGMGYRVRVGCYDQYRTPQKVTSEDLLLESGFGYRFEKGSVPINVGLNLNGNESEKITTVYVNRVPINVGLNLNRLGYIPRPLCGVKCRDERVYP
jgi:hypothetical protein